MPLYKNTFQPFFPDTDSPYPSPCFGEYCNLVASGDIVYQEWYQTPCAGNMVLDPNYDNISLGANMITNGTFIGSAAGWTLGFGWGYSTDSVTYTLLTPNNLLYQSGIGLVAGNNYRVTFDVTIGSGTMAVNLGSGAGVTTSVNIAVSGSYVIDLLYNDTDDIISFQPTGAGNVIVLDNVTCQLITFNDWVQAGDRFTFADGFACKNTLSGAGAIYNGSSDYIVSGDYYQVEVTVDNYISGAGYVYIDDGTGGTSTNVQAAITASGTYTYYITASQDGVIGFAATADFLGCVSGFSVRRLRNDFFFSLIDAAGDAYDISSTATYVENKVLVSLDFAQLLDNGDIADYGCYTIQVTDSCLVSGDNLVLDGDFSNGDFSEWTRNSGTWQYSMTGGEIQFIFDPLGDNPTKITNGDFSGGATGWTADASWTITAGIGAVHTPGSTTTLSQSITIATPAVAPAVLFTWWQVRITGRTAGSITISVSDRTSGPMTVNNTYTNVMVPTVGGVVTMAITPTSNFDGTVELVAVHEATRSWNSKPIISNPANALVVAGNYQLQYEITGISGTTANTIGGSASIRYPLTGYTYDRTVGVHSHTQDYTPGSTIIEIQGIFDLNSNYYPGTVNIDDYTVVRVEPFEATYVSECFNFQEDFENTVLITAWCDQDAWGSTEIDNLGFVTSGFLFQMRILCKSYNFDLEDGSQASKYSDGDAEVSYGQLEKYWQFTTDYLSEAALTCIGAMIRSDHFTVGNQGVDANEYVAEIKTFTPEWRDQGDYALAPVQFQLRKKIGGMKFNRHT